MQIKLNHWSNQNKNQTQSKEKINQHACNHIKLKTVGDLMISEEDNELTIDVRPGKNGNSRVLSPARSDTEVLRR